MTKAEHIEFCENKISEYQEKLASQKKALKDFLANLDFASEDDVEAIDEIAMAIRRHCADIKDSLRNIDRLSVEKTFSF